MCISNLRKYLHKKTAAKSDIKITLLDSDSLFHPAIFGKVYQA
jgi:hypothetical protein